MGIMDLFKKKKQKISEEEFIGYNKQRAVEEQNFGKWKAKEEFKKKKLAYTQGKSSSGFGGLANTLATGIRNAAASQERQYGGGGFGGMGFNDPYASMTPFAKKKKKGKRIQMDY